MEKINLREERDFGQKISDTFLFLQQNFGPLFKSLLYYAGPVALIAGVFMGLYQSNFMGLNPEAMAGANNNPFQFLAQNVFNLNYIITLVLMGLGRVVVVGITLAYITAYLERPGELISTAEVWQRFLARFVMLLVTTLFYMIAIFLATLLVGILLMVLLFGEIPDEAMLQERFYLLPIAVLIAVVPVIFLAVRMGLFPAVIYVEKPDIFSAFGRSWKLVKGKWWSTFGLLMVMSIIVSIIGFAFQIPLLLISFFKEILQWENGSSMQVIIIAASIIGILGETLLYSILHIALTFQYFNLVERQESIGLMREIDSLGREPDFNPNEGDY